MESLTKVIYPTNGDLIIHDKFGKGEVISVLQDKFNYHKVKVRFKDEIKELIWEYATEHVAFIPKLTSSQETLLGLIINNQGLNQRKISKKMGITEPGVSYNLKLLKLLGLVETKRVGAEVKIYLKGQAPEITLTASQKIILDLINNRPGLIKKEIGKITGFTQSAIWKNTNILESKGLVETRRLGGMVKVYPRGQAPAIVLSFIQKKIFTAIEKTPGLTQTEFAKKIGIPKDTLGWNIKILRSKNLVKTVGIGSTIRVFPKQRFILGNIITEIQERILNAVKESPGSIIIEIAKKLNLCKDAVGDNVKKLKTNNFVEVRKVGKTNQVYLKNNVPEGIILSLNREKILNAVKKSPGLAQIEIRDITDILPVTICANVRALKFLGLVETRKVGNKTRVYPLGQAPEIVLSQTEEAILKLVKIKPRLIQKQIAKRVGIDESLLTKYVKRLESRGLINRKRVKRGIRVYSSKD